MILQTIQKKLFTHYKLHVYKQLISGIHILLLLQEQDHLQL